MAILGPGSIFGEEVVFSKVERNTIAVCATETLLCMARAEHVYDLFKRFPQLAVNVAKYLHEQRDNALAIVEDLAYLTVPQRLLRQLNRLALEYGKPVTDGVLLDIRLTHADLAALCGTTRETTCVQMAQLAAEGLVRLEGRSIIVLNAAPSA
jgi:CRP-like cAMP-binding protein